MTTPNTDSTQTSTSKKREAILRFYAVMTNSKYEDVVNEYLGKAESINHTNRLYIATETAINYMKDEL